MSVFISLPRAAKSTIYIKSWRTAHNSANIRETNQKKKETNINVPKILYVALK